MRLCALAILGLASPAFADTLASNTGPVSGIVTAFYGQSFTIAAGVPETNLTFNFYSNVSPSTPVAGAQLFSCLRLIPALRQPWAC